MSFWDNILRYPRFFISSMFGLFLVLLTPIIKISKELKNKTLFLFLFFILTGLLLFTLHQMLDLS